MFKFYIFLKFLCKKLRKKECCLYSLEKHNAITFPMLDLAAEIIQGYEGNLSWQKHVFDVLVKVYLHARCPGQVITSRPFWLRSKCNICS